MARLLGHLMTGGGRGGDAVRRGVLAVLRNRRLWAVVPMSFTGYAVLVTVRGLWAGPYLAEVFTLSPVARA